MFPSASATLDTLVTAFPAQHARRARSSPAKQALAQAPQQQIRPHAHVTSDTTATACLALLALVPLQMHRSESMSTVLLAANPTLPRAPATLDTTAPISHALCAGPALQSTQHI